MAEVADPFAFEAAWYPLAPLQDLDPQRPTPVQLLGRRYVIWRPPAEGFRVFLDQCPHRLAPLSEGRLDGEGRLMCSYHGWCFDGAGHCRRIPQATPAEPDQARRQHLAATALPVREAVGLLWLWPQAGAEAAARAAATPLPISPFVDEAAGFHTQAMVRDLPYDWQTLVENVADPAHVPFAHHGVQGRRELAVPIPLRMVAETRALLEAEIPGRAIASATRVLFRPPCLLEYRFVLPGNRRMGLITYCLPVAPGRSRVVAQFSHTWQVPWWQRRPRWFDHATNRNEVLDGDLLMLHTIEADLAARRAAGEPLRWNRLYRLPTSADRLVIAFHRWLERHGGPWPAEAPAPAATPTPAPTPTQLLDRHGQHTVHCRSCRGALATSRRLQVAGLALAALAVAAAVLLPDQRRLPVGLPLLLLAAAGAGSALALRHRFDPWFLHRPYDHTRR
jgi:phenylpropionate dioxygenase-like ring-hydroxylating dioxygenase large terminal subunit